ncbi:MAG: hypothetical protein JWQ84_757 [Mucilaginibacter sp.]|jgi:hypothetical protein|nr:hypothetical protein [Mucilaginibacter sp.]
MKLRFVWLICVVVLCFSFTKSFSQPYRTLTIDDFRGVPHNNGEVVAYTNCSINFRYEARREKNYYSLNFNIQLTMNNDKSWMDKRRITSQEMLVEVLKHEQGHYIVAYMEQQELLREVSRTVFYADYQAAAMNIFNRIDAKYKQLNLSYDADTEHMRNREQQRSWDAYFKKRLEYMPPANP